MLAWLVKPVSAALSVFRRWPSLRSRPWVEQFLLSAPQSPAIVAIIAIGSAIRPRGHARSDLDLLVLYRGSKPKLRAPMEVDIRSYPMDRAESLLQQGHEILGWAVKFGLPLYDPYGEWEALVRSWASRLPLPSLSEAEGRAQANFKAARDFWLQGDANAAADLVMAALTQVGRSRLISKGIFPASRPELVDQLHSIGEDEAANALDQALNTDVCVDDLLSQCERLLAPLT